MDKVRNAAVIALYDVLENNAFANLAINKVLKGSVFSSLERRFVTEIVYGTIKRKNTLEWIRDKFAKAKSIEPWVNAIILSGIYQIYYLDRVPASAACNEAVNLAKKYANPGAVKFVNAVLRNIVRNLDKLVFPKIDEKPIEHLSLKYSHPAWLIKKWVGEFGIEETIKLCNFNNSKAPNTIRVNTLATEREQLLKLLTQQGIKCKVTDYAPEGLTLEGFSQLNKLSAFRAGLFLLQGEASMLVAGCLSPKRKSMIIDACAAPGTKTSHLSQLMNNTGLILACDIHDHKLGLIEANVKKLGIENIKIIKQDARQLGLLYSGKADYLLLDVPCSGLGVLRGRADLRMDLEITLKDAAFGTEKQIELPQLQTCTECGGSGAAPGTHPSTCKVCGGTGQVKSTQKTVLGHFQTIKTCRNCHGTGKIVETPCDTCYGQGKVRRNKKIKIDIPAGVDNGARLRVANEGEPGANGGPKGDLYVYLTIKPHNVFERDGDDILCEVPISVTQAMLGSELRVPTLDGTVKINIPEGTQPGASFRLKGKGINRLRGYGRGDQHVRVKVSIPTNLNEKQKETIRQFSSTLTSKNDASKGKGFFGKMKDAFMG
jgi:16S rRNA (cytosine967-C5)-methyltransferase